MNGFEREVADRIAAAGRNESLQTSAGKFMLDTLSSRYFYSFSWLGRPIILYSQDMKIR